MASGARLRSANQAFGRSRSGAFLISLEPPEQIVYTRVTCTWDYVNAATNTVPSDLCADRNPPDPTPGPDRPDLGNYTHRSRFRLVTQCFIPDWDPSYQMRLIINQGDVDEEILDFDLTLNGYPREQFSDYNPSFSYLRNFLDCQAVLPGSPVLLEAAVDGGATQPYNPGSTVRGFEHRLEIWHWDNQTLPTAFSDPLALDIRLQDPKPVTSIIEAGVTNIATAPAHGLECGSAVRIFDEDTPPTERTVRIQAVTTDTFTWDWRFYGGAWNGLETALWQPAYNAFIEQHTRCP